jgi:hypothetical protein
MNLPLFLLALPIGATLLGAATNAPAPKPLVPSAVTADSSWNGNIPAKVLDGDIRDTSRWLSEPSPRPHWLQFEFAGTTTLAGLHLYSGAGGSSALTDFTVQFWRDGTWVDVPSATVTGNRATAVSLAFDDTVAVTTTKLRIWITKTPENIARVAEVALWPASVGNVPPLPVGRAASDPLAAPVKIFLNQSGFNAGAPKRFTVPNATDGSRFEIRPAAGGSSLFAGVVRDQIGDFTAFEPDDQRDYIVAVGDLVSVPFRVGPWWLERITTQRTVDFMIDSRHYVGNDRRKCVGSYGWRDDHHFGWELHTLVPQWPVSYTHLRAHETLS